MFAPDRGELAEILHLAHEVLLITTVGHLTDEMERRQELELLAFGTEGHDVAIDVDALVGEPDIERFLRYEHAV